MKRIAALLVAIAAGSLAAASAPPPDTAHDAAHPVRSGPAPRLEVDHVMIHVPPGARERRVFERAGFTIAPDLNEHDGQGSASITVEFATGFLELAWRDTGVSVSPGLERVAQRFERMGEWRSSGWSPFAIGLRRARGAPDSLPFATRSVRGPWMRPGTSLEIISAASDTAGPRLFVVPREMAANGVPESESERDRLSKRDTFIHANQARAITAVKVHVPDGALTPATGLATEYSPVVFTRGPAWLLEITFDRGRRGVTRDLRPELPVLCHL